MKLGLSFLRPPQALPDDVDLLILPARDTWGKTHDVPPHPRVRATLSVFAATPLVKGDPSYRAISREGLPALPGEANPRDGLAWGWVCPRHPTYLEEYILPVLDGLQVPVILQDFQYPKENYCFCERCREVYARRGEVDAVRQDTLRQVYALLRERISGECWLTLHPAPCILDRFGLPPDLLDEVDGVVVPIYDLTYRLTYWMDDILFALFRTVRKPIWIELYGVEPPPEGLARALATVARYPVEGVVIYGNDLNRIREVGTRLLDDPRTESFGPVLRDVGERLRNLSRA